MLAQAGRRSFIHDYTVLACNLGQSNEPFGLRNRHKYRQHPVVGARSGTAWSQWLVDAALEFGRPPSCLYIVWSRACGKAVDSTVAEHLAETPS